MNDKYKSYLKVWGAIAGIVMLAIFILIPLRVKALRQARIEKEERDLSEIRRLTTELQRATGREWPRTVVCDITPLPTNLVAGKKYNVTYVALILPIGPVMKISLVPVVRQID